MIWFLLAFVNCALCQSWSYSSPGSWSASYPDCAGSLQSPINILTSNVETQQEVTIRSTTPTSTQTFPLSNLNGGVQVEVNAGDSLTGGGLQADSFELDHIEYHMPAEHMFDGQSYPLEIIYVHRHAASNHYANLAVVYDVGQEADASIEAVINALSANAPSVTMTAALPSLSDDYYYYTGSLTSPPCTENVEWFIFLGHPSLTQEQATRLQPYLGDGVNGANARPTQPLNDRQVYQHISSFEYLGNGFNTPQFWEDIWGDCGGLRQSPIDIVPSTAVSSFDDAPLFITHSTDLETELVNLRHTLEVEIHSEDKPINVLDVGFTQDYQLIQFHMHAPSEHAMNGRLTDLEIHYVHQHPGTGQLAVIGIMYDVGSDSAPELEDIVNNVNQIPDYGDHTDFRTTVSFDNEDSFYHYKGSLTTPPCSEIVEWFVYEEIQSISQSQFDTILPIIGTANNRPLQPLNGRTLYEVNGDPVDEDVSTSFGSLALFSIVLALLGVLV